METHLGEIQQSPHNKDGSVGFEFDEYCQSVFNDTIIGNSFNDINVRDYNKCTIIWIKNHMPEFRVAAIHALQYIFGRNNYDAYDIDCVMAMSEDNLASCEDYSKSSGVKSIYQYILNNLVMMAKRMRRERGVTSKRYCNNTVKNSDGEDVSIFDSLVADTNEFELGGRDEFLNDLEALRPKRYLFGMDLYTVLYLSYACKNDNIKYIIYDIIGYSKDRVDKSRDLIERDSDCQNMIKSMAVATVEYDNNTVKDMLGRYVYGKNSIDNAIRNLDNAQYSV